MSMNLVTLLYLIASVCFIQALKGLSHPTTSRRGNLFGMVGMAIAVATTVGLVFKLGAEIATTGVGYIVVGLLVGGTAGSIMAKRVEMTKMPELVAFMHGMIGRPRCSSPSPRWASRSRWGSSRAWATPISHRQPPGAVLGAAIGAITFSGSVIAFGSFPASTSSACSRAPRCSSPGSTC
ncbi:NAD(P)(+) transhydrogenase (Re/Si-specific) subunit beta [Pseudomonas aeruginosa]|nr:NAD(P)(+) transhydrogenase (Re/Si-specific) subunit beta [Pseudomonas aeruginosa]